MKVKPSINENKIVIENGEVKTILSEEVQRKGYMSIDEALRLSRERIIKVWNMMHENDS